jgi:hypothetical protein
MQGLYNANDSTFVSQSIKHYELILTALVDWKEEAIGHNLLDINQFNYRYLISSAYN